MGGPLASVNKMILSLGANDQEAKGRVKGGTE